MGRISIPYTPRYPEVHAVLEATRFVVLVAHRRFGKTVLAVNHLLKSALTCPRQAGRFAYVAPFRGQAKAVAWSYLKRYSAPVPGRKVSETELSVTLPGGAQVRLFGADNPDALRGLYFDGVVLDEVAQMRRDVWEEIVRPALADRGGGALFIGTPKGENLFHELFVRAQGDASGQWRALVYRVGDTQALPEAEVARLRAEMGDAAWRQEFLCDFAASDDDVLIPMDVAQAASQKSLLPSEFAAMPLVFGVDVARFGSDRTVVFPRRGLQALPPTVLRRRDNVEVAERIAALYYEERPASVFVDAGQGQGVIDILHRALPCVYEVPFGGQALKPERAVNRRTEMWCALRDWLFAGGAVPRMPELVGELSAPRYGFDARGRMALEKKEDMVKRLGRSPDLADALALTFALPVLPEAVAPAQRVADGPGAASLFEW